MSLSTTFMVLHILWLINLWIAFFFFFFFNLKPEACEPVYIHCHWTGFKPGTISNETSVQIQPIESSPSLLASIPTWCARWRGLFLPAAHVGMQWYTGCRSDKTKRPNPVFRPRDEASPRTRTLMKSFPFPALRCCSFFFFFPFYLSYTEGADRERGERKFCFKGEESKGGLCGSRKNYEALH